MTCDPSIVRTEIHPTAPDQEFDQLVCELSAEFETEGVVDLAEYQHRHPEFAERLQQLWPTLQAMASLGHISRQPSQADTKLDSGATPGLLGDFQIIREVGRGGMGVVYEAMQISLSRRVALKVLPFASVLDPKQLQRFKNEALAAAALDHPNIVGVYSTGCERSVHFYAMHLLEGNTLAEVIRQMQQEARRQNSGPTDRSTSAVTIDFHHRYSPSKAGGNGQPNPLAAPSAETKAPIQALLSTQGTTRNPEFFRSVAQLGIQAAEALEHAHGMGVIHRDIKPSNLIVDGSGHLWVTDFGLAAVETGNNLTMTGDILGTLRYMSPEQSLAKRVVIDHRTDIYSLGVTLYELITLRPAYCGSDRQELLRQLAFEEPKTPRRINSSIPADLETIVLTAMAKNPAERYATAGEMAKDIRSYLDDRPISATRPTLLQYAGKWAKRRRKPLLAVAVAIAIGAVLSIYALATKLNNLQLELAAKQAEEELHQIDEQQRRQTWARESAIPDISRLIDSEHYIAAWQLAQEARSVLPNDPTLAEVINSFTVLGSITSDPPGATVSIQDWNSTSGDWLEIGQTPLEDIRLPKVTFRWKLSKEGHIPREFNGTLAWTSSTTIELPVEGKYPQKMVFIPAGEILDGFQEEVSVSVGRFLIDRYEVTNQQYQEFVDAGGYENRKYWKQPFVRQGEKISWSEAMETFRDETGQPGPATWANGHFPQDEEDFPVRGVSWYEAAAYAEFIGKELPTYYHWRRAAKIGVYEQGSPDPPDRFIVPLSNVWSSGPARVGTHQGIGLFDVYDMAGNVKEWCCNHSEENNRIILGGAWNDPGYMFRSFEMSPANSRLPIHGFRCVKYLDLPDAQLMSSISYPVRDFTEETPATKQELDNYLDHYEYNHNAPLNTEQMSDIVLSKYRLETIRIDAAYGGQRFDINIFLPHSVPPPYRPLLWLPGIGATREKKFDVKANSSDLRYINEFVSKGWVVCWPVYGRTYGRYQSPPYDRLRMSSQVRDNHTERMKDLSRAIDYLETRQDMDVNQVAYVGLSWCAGIHTIAAVAEPRLKCGVLIAAAHFHLPRTDEVEPFRFAPNVVIPMLMINGRYDTIFPIDALQLPLYRDLGTKDKRIVHFESGHLPPAEETVQIAHEWLLEHLRK